MHLPQFCTLRASLCVHELQTRTAQSMIVSGCRLDFRTNAYNMHFHALHLDGWTIPKITFYEYHAVPTVCSKIATHFNIHICNSRIIVLLLICCTLCGSINSRPGLILPSSACLKVLLLWEIFSKVWEISPILMLPTYGTISLRGFTSQKLFNLVMAFFALCLSPSVMIVGLKMEATKRRAVWAGKMYIRRNSTI